MNDNTKKARDLSAALRRSAKLDRETAQEMEQAIANGVDLTPDDPAGTANWLFNQAEADEATAELLDALIAALSEKEQGGQVPDGYHYRYATADGESVIRKNNGGEVNGSRPIEAVPYWYTAPEQREVPEDVLRDAERYRWLRDIQSQEDDSKVLIRGSHDSCTWDELRSGTNLDNAIDAAMLAAAKEGDHA